MSSTAMPDHPPSFRSSTRMYIWATLVLVALLGASLVFYYLGTNTPTTKNGNTASSQQTNGNGTGIDENGTVPPVAPEPETILSRMGTVTKTSANSLKFESPVYNEKKGIYETKELTAEFGDSTRFIEIDRTALPVPPLPGLHASASPSRAISSAEIVVGDVVDVFANENIKSKSSFSASEVQRIVTTK